MLTFSQYTGPSVDIWSIGVIFYAALVGRLPFPGKTVEITYNKMLSGVIDIPRHLSPEARDFITRILVMNVKDRMTMAQALRHPWVVQGYDGPPDSYVPPRPPVVNEYDEEDFKTIVSFGFMPKDVAASLKSPTPDAIKSLYFLVVEKHQREAMRQRDIEARAQQGNSLIARVRRSLKGPRRLRTDAPSGAVLDISYISSRVLLMGYPSSDPLQTEYDSVDDVQAFLDKHHNGRYSVFGFVPAGATPNGPPSGFLRRVAYTTVNKHAIATATALAAFSEAAVQWLGEDAQNVVVVFGKDSLNASVCAVASLLVRLGQVSANATADAAVDYALSRIHEPLSSPATSATHISFSRNISLVSASARRMLHYFLQMLHGGAKPSTVELGVSKVQVTRTPAYDVSGGCDPIIKIQTNDVTVLKTKHARHYSARKDMGFSVVCESAPLSGLVHVILLDHDRLGNERIASFYFDVGFVEQCHSLLQGSSAPPRSQSMPADIAAITAANGSSEGDIGAGSSSAAAASLIDNMRISGSSLAVKFNIPPALSMSGSTFDSQQTVRSQPPSPTPQARKVSQFSLSAQQGRPVARRIAFVLKKAELDLEKPDKFPDNAEIVVHLYQPLMAMPASGSATTIVEEE